MIEVSNRRLSQIGLGILLLIIVRCLGEFFRLRYLEGGALTIAAVVPYIGAALATAIVLAAALVAHANGYYRAVAGSTVATVLLLLAYKLVFMS
jgi:hypothetical protein